MLQSGNPAIVAHELRGRPEALRPRLSCGCALMCLNDTVCEGWLQPIVQFLSLFGVKRQLFVAFITLSS